MNKILKDRIPVSDPFIATYDAKVYANNGNQALLDLLPIGVKSVLDIGCGAGDNAKILKSMDIKVCGVTLSSEEAKLAAEYCEQVLVANAEIDDLLIEANYYDVILLSHVLEHTVHPSRVLNRLATYLIEDGLVLVAVPNPAHYRYRPRLLMGNWHMTETGPFDQTHLHFWSFDTASEIPKGTPFEVVCKLPGNPAFPLWPLRRLLPNGLTNKVDRLSGILFPNLCSIQTLIVLKKSLLS
jgi:SAM-dependent methyltransferase